MLSRMMSLGPVQDRTLHLEREKEKEREKESNVQALAKKKKKLFFSWDAYFW